VNQPSRILVPVDLSEASAHALRYASRLAARFDATLLVLHARDLVVPLDFGAPMTPMVITSDSVLAELAREEVQTFAETNVSTQVPFEVIIAEDTPVNAIGTTTKSTRADLIVIGTHGRTGFRRLVLGSVTESVMRNATVPVLTIGMHTADSRVSPALPRIACYVDDPESAKRLLEVTSALAGDEKNIVMFSADTPEDAIAKARAIHADLIALATPSRHDALDVLRGTAVERIVQQSFCPVLVVGEASPSHVSGDPSTRFARSG